MMRAGLPVVIVWAALTTAAAAAADEPDSPEAQASAFLQRGLAHYDEGQYELAIVEFRAGFAIDPRPEFLFALAQAERLSGDCAAAVVYYERFLATNPAPNQAEAARVNAKRCQRALESKPEPQPEEDSEEDSAADAEAAAPEPLDASPGRPRARRAPWYRDPVALSLLAGGAASAGAGAWFWRAAGDEARRAGVADNYADYAAHMQHAKRSQTIAWVGAGVGSAALTAAAMRALSRSARGPERPLAVATPASSGAIVSVLGRF